MDDLERSEIERRFSSFRRMDEMGLREDMAGWLHLARFVEVKPQWDGQLGPLLDVIRCGKGKQQTEDAIRRAFEMASKAAPEEWKSCPWDEGTKRMLYWFGDAIVPAGSVEDFLQSMLPDADECEDYDDEWEDEYLED